MGAGPEQRQGRLLGEPEAGTAAPAAGQGTQRLWPRGPSRPARPHRCGAHLRPSAAWPCPGRAPRGRGRCVGSGAWGCAGVGGGCGVTRGRAEASFLIRGLAGPVGGAGLHSEGRKASSALSSRLRSRPETLGAALALALASVCSPRAAPAQRGPSEPAADLAAARDAVGPFYRGEDQGAAPPQAGPRSAGSTRGGGGRGGGALEPLEGAAPRLCSFRVLASKPPWFPGTRPVGPTAVDAACTPALSGYVRTEPCKRGASIHPQGSRGQEGRGDHGSPQPCPARAGPRAGRRGLGGAWPSSRPSNKHLPARGERGASVGVGGPHFGSTGRGQVPRPGNPVLTQASLSRALLSHSTSLLRPCARD